MKFTKFFLFFLTFFCFERSYAGPLIEWQVSLGGAGDERATDIQITPDGGYIVVGYTNSSDRAVIDYKGGEFDAWVVKLSESGEVEWKRTLGGSQTDMARSVISISDGSYLVLAMTNSNDGDVSGNHGNYDIWVVRLDPTGEIMWQKTYGGSNFDGLVNTFDKPFTLAGGILWTDLNRFWIGGATKSLDGDIDPNTTLATGHDLDGWYIRIDLQGALEYQKRSVLEAESVGDIAWEPFNGYVPAQYSVDSGSDESWVSLGTNRFVHHGIPKSITHMPDQQFILLADYKSDFQIAKFNAAGIDLWSGPNQFGGSGDDNPSRVAQAVDNKYIVVGSTNSTDGIVNGACHHGDYDGWVVVLDQDSDQIHKQYLLGGSGFDTIESVRDLHPERGYIVVGHTNSSDGDIAANYGGYDIWVAKLSEDVEQNCTTGIHEPQKMTSVFPNPAKSFVKISGVNIHEPIIIFDAMGRKVFSDRAEKNEITINISGFPNGTYIVQSGRQRVRFVKAP